MWEKKPQIVPIPNLVYRVKQFLLKFQDKTFILLPATCNIFILYKLNKTLKKPIQEEKREKVIGQYLHYGMLRWPDIDYFSEIFENHKICFCCTECLPHSKFLASLKQPLHVVSTT